MLDLALYRRIRLNPRPPMQRLIADLFLRADYRNVAITVEGHENVPDTPVLFAMNHTDNFNYWPFQYWMHRRWGRYTATWVKGKNYEHPAVAAFMRWTNNIPIASRGYLITRDFLATVGRRPETEEYRALRDAVNEQGPVARGAVPEAVLDRPRSMLGRPFHPGGETYAQALEGLYDQMMAWFIGLNRYALGMDLDLLVFPQGTRSIRLSRGHIGVAQAALALGVPVVPVGCNRCDLVYPGSSPISKPGAVTYRVGEPMMPADFADLAPREDFEPFTREAEARHRARFQAVADRIMEHIDPLLDERHRFTDDRASDGTRGTDRFV
ncbi:MAG TPA: 1-acyl-sn-glycerol-3-phosphate acyltransferase [Sandaracinaceae bacterium LLY-WYZ-13_1]|nr:1-acyl-sn-glycerol-3-phosphate acyltransferase [Sandaracinaceae bacterium LLY-WYZ-13_1]